MYFNSELTTPRDSKMDEIIIKNLIFMIRRGPSLARHGRAFDNHMVGNEEESSFMFGGPKFWN